MKTKKMITKLMKQKLLIQCFLVIFAITIFGCKKSDPEPDPVEPEIEVEVPEPEEPEITEPVIPINIIMQNSDVKGVVKDEEGNFLSDVNITTGEVSTTTNGSGLFVLEKVGTVNNRSVLKFSKSGYFTITRSAIKKDEASMEVVMHKKGSTNISSQTNFSAASGKTLEAGNMKVDIPAASLVKSDGNSYTGNVNADMLYLDPNNENFTTMMPGGDLSAVRSDYREVTLISYGMVEVTLTDDAGNPLQLKDDGTSEMTYPIPAGMENNPPQTMPLWYFNEDAGVWVEEGIAELKGNVYVGKVKHFSWHNLDWPEERVTINGIVTDCENKPVSGIKVTVDQTSDITNSKGEYSVFVPANTPVTVTVLSDDYLNYTNVVSYDVPGKPGNTTVVQNVQLPCMPVISGKVVNSCSELVAVYVWCEYTINSALHKTTPRWTLNDGTFKITVPAISGNATIYVGMPDGTSISKTITLTGQNVIAADIEICNKIEDGYLTIIPEGESTITTLVDPSKTEITAIDSYFMTMGEITIIIEDYSNDENVFENVSLAVTASNKRFSSDKIQLQINSRNKSFYNITISGSGKVIDMQSFKSVSATITGKFDIAVGMVSSIRRNVANWNALSLPANIPVLDTPIEYVMSLSSPTQEYSLLLYENKGISDYNRLKTELSGKGAVFSAEVTEDGITTVAYQIDTHRIALAYSENGAMTLGGIDYPLMIMIYLNAETKSSPVLKPYQILDKLKIIK